MRIRHKKKHLINSISNHLGLPSAIENNIISFDANGLPKDSGISASGVGDMLKSIYDPTSKNSSAFLMDNMVEGSTTKILTALERTDVSNSVSHIAASNPHSDSAPLASPTFTGSVTLEQVVLGTAATSFFVNDSGVVKTRTATQVLLDIGASAIVHVHAGSDITSGILPDARIQVTGVTQHAGSIDHNSLASKQGGITDQYWHLTTVEHAIAQTVVKISNSTSAPDVNFDTAAGYDYGSLHTQTGLNGNITSICMNPSTGAAMWVVISGEGSTTTDVILNGKVDITGGASKGQVAYISGGSGEYKAEFKFGDRRYHNPAHVAGLFAESKGNNQDVKVVTKGKIIGTTGDPLNTSFYSVGTRLHLSTDGNWIGETVGGGGVHGAIGRVLRQHTTEGVIEVDVFKYVHSIRAYQGTGGILEFAIGSTDNTDWISFQDLDASEFAKLTVDGFYIDQINEYGSGSGVTIDGVLVKDNFIADSYISIQTLGTPTYTNQREYNTLLNSVGVLSDSTLISDAGGATINIATSPALLRATDSSTTALLSIDVPALNGQAIPTDTVRYIGVEYNAGTPRYTLETDDVWNENTEFRVGRVINESGTLHVVNCPQVSLNYPSRILNRFYDTRPLERADRLGGLKIGETGTRNFTMSTGALWDFVNVHTITAIDTSVSDTYDTYTSVGLDTAGATQWDNQSYDSSGVKTTLTNNRYANLWWYLELDGHIAMVYGTAQYSSPALAQAESVPSTIPLRLQVHGRLLGRFIFQKGDATATVIESAFEEVFVGAATANHNELSNLQGGAADDYQHLTTAQHNALTGGGDADSYHKHNNYEAITLLVPALDGNITLTAGDGLYTFTIPSKINGMDLVALEAIVYNASSSGDVKIMLHNLDYSGGASDILSAPLVIPVSTRTSTTYTIDPTKDDVATGDRIRIDIEPGFSGTGVLGLDVIPKYL